MTCHKSMAGLFTDEHLQTSGLQETITSFGGCFSSGSLRTGTKLSAHSWGIAIDLNLETNAQGTSGNMHPAVVGAFRDVGFKWGGEWQGRSLSGTLYIGFTGYLHRRVFQHKFQPFDGFAKQYGLDRPLYWESYDEVHKAIGREKQLKG